MGKLSKRSDGRYCKQVYIGQSAENKKAYKNVYGATIKEVEKATAELKAKIGKGFDPTLSNTTFKAYADMFKAKKSGCVGVSWQNGINNNINHLKPIWNMQIDKIKSIDIQNILNELAGWHNGKKPLSHKSLNDIYNTCIAIFEGAIPDCLQYNPCNRFKISVPTGAGATKRHALNDEQQALVQNVKHRAKTAAMIMMFAGVRCGEVCALTWADIDLEKGTIRVCKSINFKTNEIKVPKTNAGNRVVSIPKNLIVYLKSIKSNDLYVVMSARGKTMTLSAFRKMWESYMATLKKDFEKIEENEDAPIVKKTFEPFTAHQLRHTYASLLYKAGVDVLTAKEQLGHSDVKTTLNIYTHLDKIYKVNSMSKLDNYLGNNDDKDTDTGHVQVKA